MLERYFDFSRQKTSLSRESLAGLTTFLTMAYIMFVNPSILSTTGMDETGLATVTILVAAISSIAMGVFGKAPIAMAPGMGLNAFFAFTLVQTQQIPWETALGMVFLAGVAFLLLGGLGLREKIIEAIPASQIAAIGAGIGFFLLFIGLKNLGLVVDDPATLVRLGTFTPGVLIGLFTLLLSMWLMVKKQPAAILVGILAGTILGLVSGEVSWPERIFSPQFNLDQVAFKLDIMGALKWEYLGPIFALFFVDMFDTIGTLVAVNQEAGRVKKDGTIPGLGRMLQVDALATMLSGLLGTSPTTSYIESATGVAAGGKTGFSAVVCGLLFLLGLLVIPLIMMVPGFATAPALIIVGMLMLKPLQKIKFDRYEESFPAILTVAIMVFSFQIATGIAFGFISWGLLAIFTGKSKKIKPIMYLVILLSLLSLIM
ncbi:MAG: NCS2 family permease [Bacteroidota bacterium]